MIVWICNRCAEKAGGRIPDGHIATWHWDICDACGKRKPCTQPRDFQPRPDRDSVMRSAKESGR